MSEKSVAINERGYRIGQEHHNARYTDGEVQMVLVLRGDGPSNGGKSYGEIAKIMDMPKSTVRDICTAKRRCQTAAGHRTVRVSET